jgi:hypothetical protein
MCLKRNNEFIYMDRSENRNNKYAYLDKHKNTILISSSINAFRSPDGDAWLSDCGAVPAPGEPEMADQDQQREECAGAEQGKVPQRNGFGIIIRSGYYPT